ncbi:MAG: NnrU family protein [Bauldia sp.]|nr:NnrU family protein [Bauldia sp.]
MSVTPWTEFFLALAAFVAAHVVLPMPTLRARLIRLLGIRAYLLVYSALSIVLLVWVIAAARRAPYLALWPQQTWQVVVPAVLVPVAAWLLIAGLIEPNPLSISVRGESRVVGPLARITRHPVLWAFLLWSASHIVPNGDLVSLILFGGLSLLALAGFRLVDRRARRRLGEQLWDEFARTTSVIPFGAVLAGRGQLSWAPHLTWSAIAALAVTAIFAIWLHPVLTGTDPVALLGL